MSTLLSLLLLLHVLNTCYCQTTGDLRLTHQYHRDNFTVVGRLEIFWEGKWGTFCNINDVGTAVACKQVGYHPPVSPSYAYEHYGAADNETREMIPGAGDDVPIAITNTFCGQDNRMISPIHILRCGYSTDRHANLVPCTSHNYDIILQCFDDNKYAIQSSQIRLVGGASPSSGTMEVYNVAGVSWGNVCNSRFDQRVADTACRQMGYTNAVHYGSTKTMTADVVWLDGVECGGSSESCKCLNNCFQWPQPDLRSPVSCPSGEYVTINCTFDVERAKDFNASSGGWELCQDPQTCELEFSESAGIAPSVLYGVSGAATAIILLLIILLVTMVVCFTVPSCPLSRSRQRRGFELVTNN